MESLNVRGPRAAPDAQAELLAGLCAAGEHIAAGFLELPEADPLTRMARALRRQLERAAPPAWQGSPLYPCGRFDWYAQNQAVTFRYSHSLFVNQEELRRRVQPGAPHAEVYEGLRAQLGDYPMVGQGIDPDVALGGANYTHSILNYGRIVRDGLDAYAQRVARGLQRAEARGDAEQRAFYAALADLLAGIECTLRRSLEALLAARPEEHAAQAVWARLVEALHRVPRQPARDFYEALVAVNWMYYLDGCDSLGRFDQDLGALYEDDVRAGRLSEEQGASLVAALWDNVDANGGWNVAIGGNTAEGGTACNLLTGACLRAAKGRRRPNLALRLSAETPAEIWDVALDALASGCGIPALYHEELYLRAIRAAHLNIAPQDLPRYAFGGCTELMVHGCSNVGSLDGGLNLPLILAHTLREHLDQARGFETLWQAFEEHVHDTIARMVRQVNRAQELHARYQPQPIRTLFIDDCVDAGVEYNAGGARYNWSVLNVGGLGNVADSLAALRAELHRGGPLAAQELRAALESDFSGYEALRQRLLRYPKYGNDDPSVDELAQRVATLVFEELRRYAPWRGGRFVPSCLMFATYARAGEPVMATPDGRHAAEPIADSIGAVQGRDRHGPTALLRSTASIPQHLAPGTLVTNLRLAPSMFAETNRAKIKDLVRTYFALGGMQLQITVVDQDTLRRALADPERYGDLIVRIGGYSEYWRNLSPALRQTVYERTEHAL
jgi:pyruvate-formate lyase